MLAMLPLPAYASGDPGVLFEIFFMFWWYVAGALIVLLSKHIHGWRLALLGAYVACAVPIWNWYLNSPGPDFTLQTAVTAGYPPTMIVVVRLLALARRNRGGRLG